MESGQDCGEASETLEVKEAPGLAGRVITTRGSVSGQDGRLPESHPGGRTDGLLATRQWGRSPRWQR